MHKSIAVTYAVLFALVLVGAKPIPQWQNNDLDVLAPADAYRYSNAFWFGRPYYEMDDAGDNAYSNSLLKQRTSTLSYASVGAGWGR
ncbi:uncharacterized protein LOC116430587 [Nomia melanderi]|uniref:uncharacterized protein LOC116430587 n=1 Tax=Nomia melanderi TaxID=2448451 RepID=UPI0013041972|nr:uncharacterized protein LOC116430587 [Nomia melanderi]